jgi:hypothetical protein
MRSLVAIIIGTLFFAVSSAFGQTPAPAPGAAGTTPPATATGGLADWWWIILLVIVIAAAIWYFTSRRPRV